MFTAIFNFVFDHFIANNLIIYNEYYAFTQEQREHSNSLYCTIVHDMLMLINIL